MIAFLAAFDLQPPDTKSIPPDAVNIRFRSTREPIIASTDDTLTMFPRCQVVQSIALHTVEPLQETIMQETHWLRCDYNECMVVNSYTWE